MLKRDITKKISSIGEWLFSVAAKSRYATWILKIIFTANYFGKFNQLDAMALWLRFSNELELID